MNARSGEWCRAAGLAGSPRNKRQRAISICLHATEWWLPFVFWRVGLCMIPMSTLSYPDPSAAIYFVLLFLSPVYHAYVVMRQPGRLFFMEIWASVSPLPFLVVNSAWWILSALPCFSPIISIACIYLKCINFQFKHEVFPNLTIWYCCSFFDWSQDKSHVS